ncbi:MAG: hypothetical protein JJU23_15775 [Cyclobacteriaceae bacterium]|nr:hypothetical protein [Cyclobacteriaceae bacterium]
MKTRYFLIIWLSIFLSCNTESKKSTVQEDETTIEQLAEVNSVDTYDNGTIDNFNEEIIFYQEIDYSKHKVKYHLWEPTASTPKIIKWNIEEKDAKEYFIQETIDEKNRVIEIKFMRNNDSVYNDFTIFESPITRFYYEDNKVTVVDYDSEFQPAELFEAGLATQITYFLNKENFIEAVTAKVYVSDHLMHYFGMKTIKKGVAEIKSNVMPTIIFPYYFTDNKMNGVIPKGENFDEKTVIKPYNEE